MYRGGVWMNKRQYDRAFRDFDDALRLDPGIIYAYRYRGIASACKHDYGVALKDLDEAVRLMPADNLNYILRGCICGLNGDYDRAIRELDDAIRINPKEPFAYVFRGRYQEIKGQRDKALEDIAAALRLDPRCDVAYAVEAWLWAHSSDPMSRDGTRAVAAATKACELTSWSDSFHLAALADAYSVSGDQENTMKWRKKARELDPELVNPISGSLLDLFRVFWDRP
jgi:tetratricopeptide (TPR) repeat protein